VVAFRAGVFATNVPAAGEHAGAHGHDSARATPRQLANSESTAPVPARCAAVVTPPQGSRYIDSGFGVTEQATHPVATGRPRLRQANQWARYP